ncbi:hypothetical protein ACOSQ3_004626 [Xanthoceras sorbifolium]
MKQISAQFSVNINFFIIMLFITVLRKQIIIHFSIFSKQEIVFMKQISVQCSGNRFQYIVFRKHEKFYYYAFQYSFLKTDYYSFQFGFQKIDYYSFQYSFQEGLIRNIRLFRNLLTLTELV